MDSNQVNDGVIKNNERKGRGLFYGVIALAVFIIMAVGATFAYFAATAASANNSITTGSTSLSLSLLSYETAWSKTDLIPVDTPIVQYAFAQQDDTTRRQVQTCYNSESIEVDCDDESVDEGKTVTNYVEGLNNTMCVDDYGNSVCSVYVFQVINDNASPQTMTFSVASYLNTFTNLQAMAYELSIGNSDDYNSTENNNQEGDPEELTVMNGSTPLEPQEYTAIYVNRKGVSKQLLKYSSGDSEADAADRPLVRVEDGTADTTDISMRSTEIANGVEIGSGETRTYAIVLYIHNLTTAQPEDENSLFQGSINVTTGDGTTGVSGFISAAGSGEELEP